MPASEMGRQADVIAPLVAAESGTGTRAQDVVVDAAPAVSAAPSGPVTPAGAVSEEAQVGPDVLPAFAQRTKTAKSPKARSPKKSGAPAAELSQTTSAEMSNPDKAAQGTPEAPAGAAAPDAHAPKTGPGDGE